MKKPHTIQDILRNMMASWAKHAGKAKITEHAFDGGEYARNYMKKKTPKS